VTKGFERKTGSGDQKTIVRSTRLYDRVLEAFGFYFSETFPKKIRYQAGTDGKKNCIK
jgi:hypothetical protein